MWQNPQVYIFHTCNEVIVHQYISSRLLRSMQCKKDLKQAYLEMRVRVCVLSGRCMCVCRGVVVPSVAALCHGRGSYLVKWEMLNTLDIQLSLSLSLSLSLILSHTLAHTHFLKLKLFGMKKLFSQILSSRVHHLKVWRFVFHSVLILTFRHWITFLKADNRIAFAVFSIKTRKNV